MNRNPDPRIYFIRPVGAEGPIKVGYSAEVAVRYRQLAKWSPIPLELVATLEVPPEGKWGMGACGRRLELKFHRRYAPHWMHYEWFAAHPLILSDIERIQIDEFDIRELEMETA